MIGDKAEWVNEVLFYGYFCADVSSYVSADLQLLAPDAATLDDTPTCRSQGGVDVCSTGFGFVHG